MKVYHQTGHNYRWNIDSFEAGIGDGLIYSPINIDADKLLSMKPTLKETSFLDPQLYLLDEMKGCLDTYPYFPRNWKPDFITSDIDSTNIILAQSCLEYQLSNNFEYFVIPTRYYWDNPVTYFTQSTDYFVVPFCQCAQDLAPEKKILLSVIVKENMLSDENKRDEVLNWITGQTQIDGVYLIFEDKSPSKQIKDFDFLINVLNFIKILKINELEVHLWYTNTEAILYSIAMPDSISIGSYENLRSFGIKRFQDLDSGPMQWPRPRLYSAKLLQWIDYQYIEAMRKLIPSEYEGFFEATTYQALMFQDTFKWHFSKPELYKHYFEVFTWQIKSLPDEPEVRTEELERTMRNALQNFKFIENKVLLDDNSNWSHLPTWINVLKAFQQT